MPTRRQIQRNVNRDNPRKVVVPRPSSARTHYDDYQAASAAGVSTPLFDDVPGGLVGYSLRALSTAWIPSAVIRIRRTSDNAESDFTAAQITDGTLAAWVAGAGAAEGAVVIWYDQSGNGHDATTVIAARQPFITSGGAVVLINAAPAIVWDSTNSHYLQNIVAGVSAQPNTFSWVGQVGDTSLNILFDGSGTAPDRQQVWFDLNQVKMHAGTTILSAAHALPSAQEHLVALFNGAGSEVWIDGVSVLTGNPGGDGFGPIRICTDFNLTPYLEGWVQELACWNADQSGVRATIETNITNHYT